MSEVKTIESAKAVRVAPAPIDPDKDPAGYLQSKGWRLCDGDPRREASTWYDPTKPLEDKYEKKQVATRKINNKDEPVFQTVITPAAWPLPRNAAVLLQLERDAAMATAAKK